MYGYIYITENLITHKKYIGQKKSTKFLGNKYLGSGKYLKNAVEKYGKNNFSVIMLDSAETFDELNEKEKYYIAKYNAVDSDDFYNMSPGGVLFGEGHIKHHTEETKEKISKASSGKNNKFYGQHHTEETKAKLRESWKKRRKNPVSEETRKKMSESRKGRKFTEEHRRKISEAQKGCKGNNYGKTIPQEVRKKISETVHSQKWMNNGTVSIRVNVNEVNVYLENGYVLGRLPFKKGSTTIEKVLQEKDL